MKVAVLGGTGKMGIRVAKLLAKKNQVIIGSRDLARAKEAALKIPGAEGETYSEATRKAEVVLVAVPYGAVGALSELAEVAAGKLVLSMVNPLRLEGGLMKYVPERGSAAEEVARLLPMSKVATAFNNIPFGALGRDEVPEMDVLVAAETREVFEESAEVIRSVGNLRPLWIGPLSEAQLVERGTSMLVNIARLNGTKALAFRFVSG